MSATTAARRDSQATGHELSVSLERCAEQLVEGARAEGWRGADPYDGLYWRWPAAILATQRQRQIVTQLHARAPIDVRAWRRAPRPRLAKTLALFAKAALLANDRPQLVEEDLTSDHPPLAQCRPPSGALHTAGREALEELDGDCSAGERAWGYPFAVQTRWSGYPANSPNVVVSAFAIDSLSLGAELLNEPSFARRARRASEWLAETLLRTRGHFAYHEHSDALIHNASLLGAAAVYRTLDDPELVRQAVELALQAQRSDGSWPYGEGDGLGFVDSFHTGYVLSSLVALEDVDPAVGEAVKRGTRYWTERFFDERGRALLWAGRPFPEDGHSTGTALSTLALLAQREPVYLPLLAQVSRRALAAMVVGGHAVHRRWRLGRTLVRYPRWCDGHIAAGMMAAASTLSARHGMAGLAAASVLSGRHQTAERTAVSVPSARHATARGA